MAVPMDRRTFLKTGAMAAGAAALTPFGATAEETAKPVGPEGVVYRTLGRTGLQVSTISMGAFLTSEPKVIQAALELGVNLVDTARIYMDGKNEEYVRDAIDAVQKDHPERTIHIVTKAEYGPRDAMMESAEESLTALNRKSVDIFMLHKVPSKNVVMNEEYRGVLKDLKAQGKTRFVGVSCHKNMAEVLNALADDPEKLYDVALVSYCYKSAPAVKEAIARAANAGIGIIAMKTQGGGYDSKEYGDIKPHQAALKWVLSDPNVSCAIPSMVNLDQVKEDIAVMSLKMAKADQETLHRYNLATADRYCHQCGKCEPTCPYGVDIATVNRCLMYAEGYNELAVARSTYEREVSPAASLAQCGNCTTCTAQCMRGLNLPMHLDRARQILT